MSIAYDLFDSIGIIVDAKLQNLLQQAGLLVCTITDDSQAHAGIYTVFADSSTFVVNSTITDLKTGDLVYVGIPSGNNYSDAFIIAKKMTAQSEDSSGLTFKDYVKCINLPLNDMVYSAEITNINNFTKLGLTCVFNPEQNNNDNNLLYINIHTKEEINNQYVIFSNLYTIDLNNKVLYNTQDKTNLQIYIEEVLDISGLNNINKIIVSTSNNTIINDLSLSLGEFKDKFKIEGLSLYSDSELAFSKVDEQKNIYARLVYKEQEEYKIITPFYGTLPEGIQIKWENNETQINNQTMFIQTSPAEKYSPTQQYELTVEFIDFDQDEPQKFNANISILNQIKRDIIFNEENITLISPTILFRDIYQSNGTIIERNLSTNKEMYTVSFNNNPVNFVDELQFRALIKIPKFKTALVFDEQYTMINSPLTWVLKEDSDEYVIYQTYFNQELKYLCNYKITSNYVPNMINNFIVCTIEAVDKNDNIVATREYKLDIKFERSGICDTDYVLFPSCSSTVIKSDNGSIDIVGHVYNQFGEEIEILDEDGINWSWLNFDNPKISITKLSNNACQLNLKGNIDPAVERTDYILKGTLGLIKQESKTLQQIECYIPIAISFKVEGQYLIDELQGPTIITYNSLGVNPSFYTTNYTWLPSNIEGIELASLVQNSAYDSSLHSGYPYIAKQDNDLYKLIAPTMYVKGCESGACIQLYSDTGIHFTQPLYCHLTTSFSSYINDWDGSLKVDESENTISAARFAVGKKEGGKFSGVILGDWEPKIEDDSTPLTGIYGYGQGEQSYALKEDGTAFFGKAGEGRIEFDGNIGVIQSANFDGTFDKGTIFENINNANIGTQGSYIDLKNGYIITKDGYFRGEIQADKGKIGEWEIEQGALKTKYTSLLSDNVLIRKSSLLYPGAQSEVVLGFGGKWVWGVGEDSRLYSFIEQNTEIERNNSVYWVYKIQLTKDKDTDNCYKTDPVSFKLPKECRDVYPGLAVDGLYAWDPIAGSIDKQISPQIKIVQKLPEKENLEANTFYIIYTITKNFNENIKIGLFFYFNDTEKIMNSTLIIDNTLGLKNFRFLGIMLEDAMSGDATGFSNMSNYLLQDGTISGSGLFIRPLLSNSQTDTTSFSIRYTGHILQNQYLTSSVIINSPNDPMDIAADDCITLRSEILMLHGDKIQVRQFSNASSPTFSGQTGWIRSENARFIYFLNGICVGSLYYASSEDPWNDFLNDVSDKTEFPNQPSYYDHLYGSQTSRPMI